MSNPPFEPFWVQSDDWHTAGEPFRIIDLSLLPSEYSTTGKTVKERRQNIINTPDHPLDTLRRALCHEPRGHADMYGGYIVPGDDEGAHFGVLFWHKDGFSTACGHGTIALGCWAVRNGLVTVPENGTTRVIIDVPSGRVSAEVVTSDGKVKAVNFINVPSYQIAQDIPVTLPTGQAFTVDLGWGGAVYAFVNTSMFNYIVEPKQHDDFISPGRQIKAALGVRARHENLDLYGVCFYQELEETENTIVHKNVVVFADGQIDRSPCGSGTAARVAVLLAQDRLKGKRFIHRSIVDTVFEASVVSLVDGPTIYQGCIPKVTGLAHLIGEHRFYIDQDDPTFPGFVFR